MKPGNKNLPFDEVVDTIADAFDCEQIAQEALKDGFQFTDSFQIIRIYPKLKEIFDDRKIFIAQFFDLDTKETELVVKQVGIRIGVEDGNVVKARIYQVLNNLSKTYTYLDMVVYGGKQLAADWGAVFSKN